jgi:hypothetical protein
MPRAKPVLILSDVNVDEPTWSWAGFAETNILDYERRWGAYLLDPEKPLAVIASLPSNLSPEEVARLRKPWEHEKQDLKLLFSRMQASLGLRVDGPFDLTRMSRDDALREVEQLLRDYEQVIGIAHVPPPAARKCPACGQQIQSERTAAFFELGGGGKLDRQVITRIAERLGRRERRVIFLGCRTLPTDLPKTFVESGLSLACFKTTSEVSLADMLLFLRAMLMTSYAKPGNEVLDKLWAAYQKLRGFPCDAAVDTPYMYLHSILILEGSPSTSREPPYYIAEPCPNGGLPHLQPLSKDDVLDSVARASRTLSKETLVIADVPKELRSELAGVLRGRSVLWVAAGATCRSVGEALPQEEVEYHLGYVQTTSQYLVYRFLHDYYVCVSVHGMSPDEFLKTMTALAPNWACDGGVLRRFLFDLACDRMIVGGAKP